MKKIMLFLLSCCMVVSVSASSSSSSSSSASTQRRTRSSYNYGNQSGLKTDYTAHECFIESIEDGDNDVAFYVRKYGYEILHEIDRCTGQNALELACAAKNDAAVQTIHKYLRYKKINRPSSDRR